MNSVFSFNKIQKVSFSFLAVGFCPKNLAFARKIMALPQSGGCNPGSYAYDSRGVQGVDCRLKQGDGSSSVCRRCIANILGLLSDNEVRAFAEPDPIYTRSQNKTRLCRL